MLSQLEENLLSAVTALKGSSLLFVGEDKQRMNTAAENLAKNVNCLSEKENLLDKYCQDNCSSCAKISKRQHPDVAWIEPKGGSSKIKIEDIRKLKGMINLKPYEARKKVFIIQEAERLTPESANALLKTLEEPPADAVVILVAESTSQLLPTVVSRCQLIRFSGAQSSRSEETDAIDALLIRIFEDTEDEQTGSIIDDISSLDRKQCEQVFQELSFVFRDMLMNCLGVNDPDAMSRQSWENIVSWSAFFNKESIESILDEVMRIKRYIQSNANIKLSVGIMMKTIQSQRLISYREVK